MKPTQGEFISLFTGIILLVSGITLFFGVTRWGHRSYNVGKLILTNEAVGIILFILGMCFMLLGFFIPVLSPRFLSPGMS